MTPFDWDAPVAKPLACIIAAVLLLIGIGAAGSIHYRAKAVKAENAANVAKGEADAAKSQAMAKDKEIAAKDSSLAVSRSEVARRLEELRKIKAALHASVPSAPVGPSIHDEPVHPGVVDLSPVVAKQDEVIQAQSVLIRDLDTRVFDLTVSRDSWKASSDAREREAAGLRIALEAQKALTKSALWKGRIQGLVVGIGSGFVAGRLR